MNRSSGTVAEPVSPPADQLLFSLLGAAHHLESRIEAELGQVGLSMSKLGVLTQLVEAGKPLPLSELAARLSCVRSNMTQLIDRLEAEGLVRRVDDPSDRRSVLAMVTELGEQKQGAGAGQLALVRERFVDRLPPGDREALVRAIAALA
jgi:DNA-binding MarR family transcriptional regulator